MYTGVLFYWMGVGGHGRVEVGVGHWRAAKRDIDICLHTVIMKDMQHVYPLCEALPLCFMIGRRTPAFPAPCMYSTRKGAYVRTTKLFSPSTPCRSADSDQV